jgi:hypothetical protein
MIELYYWPTPNGHKIAMFLEEAELDYAIHPVDISDGDQFKPEFLAISPNNRMPAIVDRKPSDGGKPISVFESGAILFYLAEKTRALLPSDLRDRKTVFEWVFWQVGGLGPMTGQNHHVVLLHARLHHLRRLAEKDLLSLFGNCRATGVWLAFGIGTLRGGALAHCVEPAAEIREGVEVLLLAFPRDNPRIGGDVGNRVGVARDEGSIERPTANRSGATLVRKQPAGVLVGLPELAERSQDGAR